MELRFILILGLAGSLALPLAGESTRNLQLELSGDAARAFAVENLAGRMTVKAGAAGKVRVSAVVHGETEAVAGELRLEQVTGEKGLPTLRVVYPARDIRYPGASGDTRSEYAGRRCRVSSSAGTLLYADVTVEVPAAAVDGLFRNVVGGLAAEGLKGHVVLDTAAGDVTVRRLEGDVKADTGSGDVDASDLQGRFDCDTGSGRCAVTRFSGEQLDLDTGSGAISVREARARRVKADAGSGPIDLSVSEAEDVEADAGSGQVTVECRCSKAARIKVDNGSGDVLLRLPATAGFELRAEQGSGHLSSGFADAEPVDRHQELVGYRRGDGALRLSVETGSGDVRVEPLR